MGLVFRGSSWRCWSKKASLFVCGLALASLPAVAQTPPQPPVNSDVAFRILPSKYNSLQMSPEVLQEQPLVRLLGEVASSYFGFNLVDDLDKAFEGTVVGAVLSDPKGDSSLADFFKDGELRGEREALVAEMRSLASDLEAYKEENETYPEDFRKYIDEVRYYEPYLPEGVTYEYQSTEQGKGFRLVMTFAEPSRLVELGPAPAFREGGKEQYSEPERGAIPLNFVLGARVSDSELAKRIATELIGEPKDGFWTSDSQPPLVATLRGSWLVAADNKANLTPFLKSLNGQAPGLSKNPGYQVVARNIDMDASGMLYVDLSKIVRSMDITDQPEEARLLALLGPAGYALTPYQHSQLRMEVFMGVNPPKGSDLEALFVETAEAKTEAAMVAGNIPWDVSNAFALDYQRSKRLFDAVLALSDEAKQSMEMAEDVWAGFLGLDAEAGFDRLVDGWVVVSFERLDLFVNALESFTEAMSTTPEGLPAELEGTGGPPSEDAPSAVDAEANPEEPAVTPDAEPDPGESEEVITIEEVAPAAAPDPELAPEGPEQEPAASETDGNNVDPSGEEFAPPAAIRPPRLPFTVAFQVTDQQARGAMVEALTKQLGEQTETKSVYGVEVLGRQDGLLSYALRDNWFYISGGNTQRLLRNLLAAATGRKPSLTSLDSWAQFRAGQRGEVIAISHQKVDAVYSIVKGFLLLLGPDFRPMADELGGLRDYHSAVFLVPDGVLCVGDVLQGDKK
jgi:hypothetical protein